MNDRFKPLDLRGITTCSLKDRPSKVTIKDFGKPYSKGQSFKDFLSFLPEILKAKDFKEIVKEIVSSYQGKRIIAWGIGAHVIKVGLSPVITSLMEEGLVSSISMTGAGAIHDSEIAISGKTSEDVESALAKGKFGTVSESTTMLNEAIKEGAEKEWGIGKALGKRLSENNLPFVNLSLIATAYRLNIPVTVHLAIGTDIIQMHPSFDGSAAGKATYLDFRLFASVISELQKGVYLNVGSAVILPEVFLKALSLVRNLEFTVDDFITIDLDFLVHYRPLNNVVERPFFQHKGKGYHITGHHEIMIPLLAAALLEEKEAIKEGSHEG